MLHLDMKSRSLLIGIFLALSACVTVQKYPTVPNSLALDWDVAQMMQRIQSEYDRETVFCLSGYIHADTVHIQGVHPAPILERNEWSASFDKCVGPSTVGMYHNHPPGRTDAGDRALYYCQLSRADIHTLNTFPNMWVSIITCDHNEETLVWRFRHADHDEYWPPLPPGSR